MSPKPSLRLVVFDCDGTLVDSQHGIVAAAAAAFRAQGLPEPDPAAVRRLVGLNLDHAILALLPNQKGPRAEPPHLSQEIGVDAANCEAARIAAEKKASH
mgnify:CR=1 FL=1